MTPYKEWFHTYKPGNGGVIYLADNTACLLVGVEDVQIKMFDGVVRTVSNVRHVTTLWKSLLSFEKFCKQGLDSSTRKITSRYVKDVKDISY